MAGILESTYEIMQELGSGGGGTVYLAKHRRLNKLVVIKADKRELTTSEDVLRREVDALKNLNHTYIPQVYDFFIEDGNICTVMDYIEGESLDKPLKRGERFTQAQIVEWACELLEALAYLHSRPPYGILHADIKPANIMLTPDGTIRLIDFNIALALGEEGAALLGFSPGYASPEHYGFDYRSGVGHERTEMLKGNEPTELLSENSKSTGSKSSSYSRAGKGITVDKRSDIYSLGATLYHLLSGERPDKSADQVKKLTSAQVSLLIAEIINKAMSPNPDLRYQTADDMLYDFRHLHENDARTKKLKKRTRTVAIVFASVFLAGAGTAFAGVKWQESEASHAQVLAEAGKKEAEEEKAKAEAAEEAERTARQLAEEEKEKERLAKEAEKTAKEKAETAEHALELIKTSTEALERGDAEKARESALAAAALDTEYMAGAQKALTDALGVYEVYERFKAYSTLKMPSEVLKLSVSPSGKSVAALSSGVFYVYDVESGELLADLPADSSALSDIVFYDDDTVIYAGTEGLYSYSLQDRKKLWTGEKATSIAISGDKSRIAAIYKDADHAVVYEAASGKQVKTIDFGGRHQSVTQTDTFVDPDDNLLALNEDGSWLAVSFSDGGLILYDIAGKEGDLEIIGADSGYKHFEGGFYDKYFAFGVSGGRISDAAVLNMETSEFPVQFPESSSYYRVRANENGVYVGMDLTIVKVDFNKGEVNEAAFTSSEVSSFEVGEDTIPVVTKEGHVFIFDKYANLLEKYEGDNQRAYAVQAGDYAALARFDSDEIRIVHRDKGEDTMLAEYDGSIRHSETRLRSDRQGFMLFDYKSLSVCDMDGKVLKEISIPDTDNVYDQQYMRDNGDYLRVSYYDGRTIDYSATDGKVLKDEIGEIPDASLYEEFMTDTLRVTSPLHGTPEIYDRATGELKGKIEQDAYLTYVTQVGDVYVMQFLKSNDDKYGLLMTDTGEILAEMPYLCDVLSDGTLIFDNMQGILRQTHIYSLNELTKMASTN